MEPLSDDQRAKIMIQTASNLSLLDTFVEAFKPDKSGNTKSSVQTLDEFLREWRNKVGYTEGYAPFNTGVILTSLWGLVVLPKESFSNLLPDKLVKDLNQSDWGRIKIDKWDDPDTDQPLAEAKKTLKNLLPRLRNAISHVLIFIKGDFSGASFTLVFEDRKKETTPVHFRMLIELNELRKFMLELGKPIMEYIDKQKRVSS